MSDVQRTFCDTVYYDSFESELKTIRFPTVGDMRPSKWIQHLAQQQEMLNVLEEKYKEKEALKVSLHAELNAPITPDMLGSWLQPRPARG